jgi:hypothetical protein
MSTKTLRKRIALVAVSALGAGLLSVVAVPSANAAVPAADTLAIYSNIAGVASLTEANGDITDATKGASTGVLSAVSGTGTTQTATMLSTGTLAVSAGAPATSNAVASIVVSGGTISKALHTSTTASFIAAGGSYAVAAGVTSPYSVVVNEELAVLVSPSAGSTSMTIQYYAGTGVTASTPTNGTLLGQMTVTVASTSAFGVVSAAKTTAYFTATDGSSATTVTDATASNYAKGNTGIVWGTINLKDAYSNNVVSGGTLIAEVTGGAKVDLAENASTSTAGSSVTAIDFEPVNETDGLYYFAVAQGTAGVAAAFTLTIKHSNGTVLATKSGKILGEVSTFTVSSSAIAVAGGGASEDSITVSFKDAAGNTVYPTAGTHPVTEVSGLTNAIVTDVSVTEYPTPTTTGYGDITCGSLSGSTKMQLSMTLPSGATVRSNEFTARCADEANTYTASFDKAVYAPGSIATLTITVKDSDGNLANDYEYLSSLTTTASSVAADKVSIVGGPSATYVTDPALSDLTTDGIITYKWVVGSTLGDFNAVVKVPAILAANSKQSSVTVAYKVAATSTGVTNEDVLKAIVSLIASINKQIAALQKALLRR